MNTLPLILITNDDGISARGIQFLVEAVKDLAQVLVVAPDGPRSAQSSAISTQPIRLNKVIDTPQLVQYACSGTPVDCVKLAMHHVVDRRPDLVLSGINHGSNASINILYSGTMGAALEGRVFGIPSIGFSLCDYAKDADFTPVIPFVRLLVQQMLGGVYGDQACLNVNFPVVDEIKGVRLCRQAKGRWLEEFVLMQDEQGEVTYQLSGQFHNAEPEAQDTDEWALAQGYVAVVPCQIDLTDHAHVKELALKECV